jgi:hypothetical protein
MQLLRQVWELWKRFGLFIGNLFGRIILTLFYFIIVLPFGLGVRFFGDPLAIKHSQATWRPRETTDRDLDDARRLA